MCVCEGRGGGGGGEEEDTDLVFYNIKKTAKIVPKEEVNCGLGYLSLC